VFSGSDDHVIGDGFSLDCGLLAAALFFSLQQRRGRKGKADFGELSRAVASHTQSKAFGPHIHAFPCSQWSPAKHIPRFSAWEWTLRVSDSRLPAGLLDAALAI